MQLLDKAVELRGSQVLNMETYKSTVLRRRIMAVATLCTWISAILYVIALSTSNWAIVTFLNQEHHDVKVELGIWGEWKTLKNWQNLTVEWIPHFPKPPETVLRLNDADLNHYYRAQAVIGVLALFMLLATNLLALFTFYHHRYVYKRLCGGLFLCIGIACFSTVEIVTRSVEDWNKAVMSNSHKSFFDNEMNIAVGYSSRLAQATGFTCLAAALAFFMASLKQKGDHAATTDLEIEDRPVHIGR